MGGVFVVQHAREFEDGNEDVKLIGVYSTEAAAQSAVSRLGGQPGFREHSEGYLV
jgi:hypothetical protein